MVDFNSFVAWYIFLVGICVGSFLNVCIYRIPENKSIVTPGSSCPNCNNSIPFHLNIPILSYLFLMGRCKFCNIPISLRYPIIELITGVFAVLLYTKFSLSSQFFYWFVFISVLITISFIDFDHQIIPDIISIPGIILFSSSFYFLPEMTLKSAGLGVLVGGGSLYAVAFVYYLLKKQEGMGGGDIKLLAMIGAATGIKGVFFTVFIGSLLGSISGLLILFYIKNNDTKLKIPFGPFLSLGAVFYIFFGDELIFWYLTSIAG
ncbi:MAG: prepilin peptidase [Pseudomonadota bacterium]